MGHQGHTNSFWKEQRKSKACWVVEYCVYPAIWTAIVTEKLLDELG